MLRKIELGSLHEVFEIMRSVRGVQNNSWQAATWSGLQLSHLNVVCWHQLFQLVISRVSTCHLVRYSVSYFDCLPKETCKAKPQTGRQLIYLRGIVARCFGSRGDLCWLCASIRSPKPSRGVQTDQSVKMAIYGSHLGCIGESASFRACDNFTCWLTSVLNSSISTTNVTRPSC